MIKLLGKKMGMTSLYEGKKAASVPATIIELGPCPVVQVKTEERDGYRGVQIGLRDGMKKRLMRKPQSGHIARSGQDALRHLREFRVGPDAKFEAGQVLTVADLDPVRVVDVIGITKGRGFAGGMKRYGFRGEAASHGVEKRHRTNGSLQGGARLTHVWKGKRMAGHMGDVRETVRNLKILEVDKERNLLVLKGSVPGFAGACVEVVQR